MRTAWKAALFVMAIPVSLAGCRVESHENKDVKVATPFGHMQVNTDRSQIQESVGLHVYPGATLDDNERGKNNSANIDMSFGSFKLRVKAITYHTTDPLDRVEAFYRNDLARYGAVIACSGNRTIGNPTRTGEGLTCEEDKSSHTKVQGDVPRMSLELKTGSRQHQHVVGLDGDAGGTKIGLVVLDLPGHVVAGDADDARQ